MEFLRPVSFIRCSVLSSLWLRWRWSGNQWVTRFSFSLWKSELFSSQCCRFRQRILASLDPSRGLLIGSRELLWKLCSIEMRLLPRWYHLLFSCHKLFIGDFILSSLFRSSWLRTRQHLKTLPTIESQYLLRDWLLFFYLYVGNTIDCGMCVCEWSFDCQNVQSIAIFEWKTMKAKGF